LGTARTHDLGTLAGVGSRSYPVSFFRVMGDVDTISVDIVTVSGGSAQGWAVIEQIDFI